MEDLVQVMKLTL